MDCHQHDVLKQFFSSYFHQDWMYDAETAKEVVLEYKKTATPDEAKRLGESIMSYLAQFEDVRTLETRLEAELGCYYMPSAHGMPAYAWLTEVAGILTEG